jgi:RNA polymerase sigma-70 factor (ECF subfamily)
MTFNSSQHARFLRMYASVQTKLYAFILSVVHNRSDADELYQETSVILWEKFENYRDDCSFAAWAIGIAKNKILEYLRENKRSKKIFPDQFYQQIAAVSEGAADDIPLRMSALQSCLERLKVSDQKLIAFRFHKNITIKMLSQLTGRSTDSLYKTMSRIMHMLKGCIERNLVLRKYE